MDKLDKYFNITKEALDLAENAFDQERLLREKQMMEDIYISCIMLHGYDVPNWTKQVHRVKGWESIVLGE